MLAQTHTHLHLHTRLHKHTHSHTRNYTNTCMLAKAHALTQTHALAQTHTHALTHTHLHKHTRACRNTHTYTNSTDLNCRGPLVGNTYTNTHALAGTHTLTQTALTWTAVGRLLGSQWHIEVMRSMASGEALVITLERGVVVNVGKRKFIAAASLTPSGHVCCVGVPMMLQILWISSACAFVVECMDSCKALLSW